MAQLSNNDLLVKISTDSDTKGIDDTESRLTRLSGSVGDAARTLGTGLVIAGTAAAGLVGYGAKIAGDLEAARQGFITLLGSSTKADAALIQIKRDAATTPFELPGLIQANQLLTSVTKNADTSEALLLNVGKALAAMGKGQPELDRVILNLQQIGATGKITELDIRQFGYAGINVLELLANYYGTTQDKASDMVKNSTSAFADLQGAFAKAGASGGQFATAFSNQAGTYNQLLSNLHDSINIALNDFLQTSGLFDLMKQGLGALIPSVQSFGITVSTQVVPAVRDFLSHRENVIGMLTALSVLLGIIAVQVVAATWPIIALTAALVGLGIVVAQAYKAWNDNLLGIRTTTVEAFTTIGGWIDWFKGHWAEAIGFVIGYALTLPIRLPLYMAQAIVAMASQITSLFNAWVGSWGAMINYIKTINWGAVFSSIATALGNALIGGFRGALSGIPGGHDIGKALHLPGFALGGIVPGPMGSPQLVIAHGGESITPPGLPYVGGKSPGQPVTINQYNTINQPVDMDMALAHLSFALSTRI